MSKRVPLRGAAARESWAATPDWSARTAPGTAHSPAALEYWESKLDPEALLPPEERARRAEQLRRAHFIRLGVLSGQARRARKAVR